MTLIKTSAQKKNYLILGGARSGKSQYAEKLASKFDQGENQDQEVYYLATAKILDNEIQNRVNRHQKDRPTHWKTLEEPIYLAKILKKYSAPNRVILVDCLTMWITNLLSENNKPLLQTEAKNLLECVPNLSGTVIFVSNEVSMGIIPMGELSRLYVDEAGRLHQKLAQCVDQVTLMVAGLPLHIKQ